ncbi:zinc ribbon domain-containing protein [uncultured Sphaerochaeta sp.]|uniref:zinc ribbon domain-containing protein n=1 Tax=uncultured Sphaerochaeta sp. TaxID=886478 RepID=UPI002A0A3CE2|nr:zinc ribbon domain-containing protein [uncultured Sphaerochaeta sp.]
MKERFCQSCGMPMGQTDELYGTESDNSKSTDYCKYCYENGAFTFQGTKEEMIDICVKPMLENNPGMIEADAKKMMEGFFPILKRWKA